MAAKCQKTKEEISLSSKKKESYKSDTRDEIDLDQANDQYPLQLQEAKERKQQAANKVVYSFTPFL